MNPPLPPPTIYNTKERTCLEDSLLNSLAPHALTHTLTPQPTQATGFPYPPSDNRDTSPKTAIGESSGHHRSCHLDIPYRASTIHWDSLCESLPFLFMSKTELGPVIRQVVMEVLDK